MHAQQFISGHKKSIDNNNCMCQVSRSKRRLNFNGFLLFVKAEQKKHENPFEIVSHNSKIECWRTMK